MPDGVEIVFRVVVVLVAFLTLPLLVDEMPDRVVWLPTNSPGSTVRQTLGVDAGAVVNVTAAAADVTAGPVTSAEGAIA